MRCAPCGRSPSRGDHARGRGPGFVESAVSHKVKRSRRASIATCSAASRGERWFTAAGEDLLDYAGRILGLHDEALLSLSKTSLKGRIALRLTEDTACSDLARILARFRRLHPHVAVRNQGPHESGPAGNAGSGRIGRLRSCRSSLMRSDRPTSSCFREELHWVKHPELSLPQQGPRYPSCPSMTNASTEDGRSRYRTGRRVVLETVFRMCKRGRHRAAVNSAMGVALLSGRHLRPEMQIVSEHLPRRLPWPMSCARQKARIPPPRNARRRNREGNQSLRRARPGELGGGSLNAQRESHGCERKRKRGRACFYRPAAC